MSANKNISAGRSSASGVSPNEKRSSRARRVARTVAKRASTMQGRRPRTLERAVELALPNFDLPYLPIPYKDARRIGEKEWREYRERQAQHRQLFPGYDAGWRRPTVKTADALWRLVASLDKQLRYGAFLPDYEWLTPEEVDDLATQAMQVL